MHSLTTHGALTKRLCGGLQNHIEQFDSATHLTKRIGNPCKSRISDSLFLTICLKRIKNVSKIKEQGLCPCSYSDSSVFTYVTGLLLLGFELISEQRIVLHRGIHLGTHLGDHLFVLRIIEHFLDQFCNEHHQVFLGTTGGDGRSS